jgi:DNA-binding NarL/FixJ family response regulator|tara:strand:- start:1078 stop:1302 length:225 start_codon:yes stop_codon:yes gene_type:complete
MICWECKGTETDGATLCECCRAAAVAEGRYSARITRTTLAERQLMRSLRAEGLTFKAIAAVLRRSMQTVIRHAS